MKKTIKNLEFGELFIHKGKLHRRDFIYRVAPKRGNEYFCFQCVNEMNIVLDGNTIVETIKEKRVPY